MAISEDENQIDQLLTELGIHLPEVQKEDMESETPGLYLLDSQEFGNLIDLLYGKWPPTEAAS